MASDWQETKEGLSKEFRFADFREALAFTTLVGNEAEKTNHHPDIDIRWNRVKLTLITHDAGDQVTEKDRLLAKIIDSISSASIQTRLKALF